MLTNLPEDETVLFHPIVFFDQGTHFFETRRWLDGDTLFRNGRPETPEGGPKRKPERERYLAVDPINPLRRLGASCSVIMQPGEARQGRPSPGWDFEVRCPGIIPGSWNLLAVLEPEHIERIASAVGELPERPPDFSEEEWLLRHAFSDDRVRENSLLAATLARLPILFARGYEGIAKFRSPRIAAEYKHLESDCRFVAVLDTGAYGDEP